MEQTCHSACIPDFKGLELVRTVDDGAISILKSAAVMSVRAPFGSFASEGVSLP